MPLIDFPEEALTFSTAALPYGGDANAGSGGLTTSAATNETNLAQYGLAASAHGGYEGDDVGTDVFPDAMDHPVASHPFWTIVLLVGFLLVVKFWFHGEEHESTQDVKIGFTNVAIVGSEAMLWFLAMKWFFGLVRFPSVSDTVDYV